MASNQAPPPAPPLTSALSSAQVAALVAGYAANPAALATFATGVFDALYPGGAPAFDAFVSAVFTHGHPAAPPTTGIRGQDRERSIIAILASRSATLELAVHFYWGIGEGLQVIDLCQILLLAGGYSGYSNYTTGLGTLSKTLGALAGLFPKDGGPIVPIDPSAALAAIEAAFAS